MEVQDIVHVLNDAFNTDPAAVDGLLMMRVPCNQAMLGHPTIQVRCKNAMGDFPTIGMLGILNAIAAKEGMVIMAKYNSATRCLIGFEAGPQIKRPDDTLEGSVSTA